MMRKSEQFFTRVPHVLLHLLMPRSSFFTYTGIFAIANLNNSFDAVPTAALFPLFNYLCTCYLFFWGLQ